MANFNIKIDLFKLGGAFVTNIKGRTETKKCLCIPVDDARLFVGEKGVYLDLFAFEMKERKYRDSHTVKQSLPSDVYQAMTDDERRAQPIIGGMHEFASKEIPAPGVTDVDDEDDLPF